MENKTKRNKWIRRIVVLLLLIAAVLVYFLEPTVNSTLNDIFSKLSSMDVKVVAEYIEGFGVWAVLVSFLLMLLQSVVAPIPAFLITFANAAIWGWWKGAILSWSSAMVGAVMCFYIARFLGQDAVAKITSKGALKQVDIYFKRYGRNTILVCRLLPFVSFDIVSYAAGLTSMDFWPFFIATGIGQLPATIVYSYVGGMLTGGTQLLFTALLIIFALTGLVFIIKSIYNNRHKDKAAAEGDQPDVDQTIDQIADQPDAQTIEQIDAQPSEPLDEQKETQEV